MCPGVATLLRLLISALMIFPGAVIAAVPVICVRVAVAAVLHTDIDTVRVVISSSGAVGDHPLWISVW